MLTFLSACDSPDEIELTTAADLVLINASIYTVDEAQSWAKTMAIKDGYIVYVGPNDEINNFIADNKPPHKFLIYLLIFLKRLI